MIARESLLSTNDTQPKFACVLLSQKHASGFGSDQDPNAVHTTHLAQISLGSFCCWLFPTGALTLINQENVKRAREQDFKRPQDRNVRALHVPLLLADVRPIPRKVTRTLVHPVQVNSCKPSLSPDAGRWGRHCVARTRCADHLPGITGGKEMSPCTPVRWPRPGTLAVSPVVWVMLIR